MSEISEIISQRGKTLLVYKNYKFNEDKKLASGEIKWKCINRKCRAYLKTVGDSSQRILSSCISQHNHTQIDSHVLERNAVMAVAKRKATEDISEKPSKILHTCIDETHKNLQIDDIKYIKKSMYNSRRKVLPALPKDINEVHTVVEHLNPKTIRGEDFVLYNNKEDNMIIFSCQGNLKFLAESKLLYMDGTFKYCPKYFLQLFTIHGFFNGHYIPLVYCLLKDKKENTYKNCFHKLTAVCRNANFLLQPDEIVVDFEMAIQKAVESEWPETKITGCRFHLAQSWWRQIQKLGLSAEYKNKDDSIGQWLRYCFGLMFLDAKEVGDSFAFDIMEIKPDDQRTTDFANYLVDIYISGDSSFPPELWAEASAELNRTTNACESFHAHLNETFYYTHPSIFLFIKTLTNIQTDTYIKCNSVHLPYKFQNTQSRKKHMLRKQKLADYKNGTVSRLTLIKLMSYYYSNTK